MRRLLGAAAFAGAAVGGTALGYLAERRAMSSSPLPEAEGALAPERGTPQEVVSPDGTRLHAEVAGREGAPTLVFAHGLGLSSATWHFQRRDLAGAFRVVAYDHRGHGGSQRSDDCSIEALADDLAAVVEQCAPDGPVLLVGHSMGGMAILALAAQHPGLVARRVAGAVLCNSSPAVLLGTAVAGSAVAGFNVLQARLAGSRIGRGAVLHSREPDARPSTDLSLLLTRHFGTTGDASPEIVAFLEAQLRACPPVVLGAFVPVLARMDLRETAASFQPPAMVVVGRNDRITPARQGRRLADALPYGKLLELDGIGHTAMLEAPDAVTEAIRDLAATALAGQDA